MGCVSSREARLDRHTTSSSYQHNLSMPIIHGSKRRGDSFHIVSLTSSTLGFLNNQDSSGHQNTIKKLDSNQNPPESETIINSWELMEGLDEETPPQNQTSFSFDQHPDKLKSPKPTSLLHLDPIVISNFRKAMTELSPKHPTLLHRSPVTYRPDEIPRFPGIVKARIAAFEEKIDARRGSLKPAVAGFMAKSPPGGKRKVVIYTTSLRGVRNTFENCCNVRGILHIYRVRIDDRDVSMHGGFRDELNEILGYGYGGAPLPRVFVDGRHLGGAEEVARLHDAGELGEVLKDCEMAMAGAMNGEGGVNCGGCGDYRFLPCGVCSGSCKVFVEKEEDEIGGFRRCMNCNENGLVRCHLCC